jgi:uncharacterized DUF497 family protein
MLKFVWDSAKAASNLRKHRVSFAEASTVFGDPLAITFADPDHSDDEEREITIGTSIRNRLLIVSHLSRDDEIRIISARRLTASERGLYEIRN